MVSGLLTGISTSNPVHQTSLLLVNVGQTAQMDCSHDLGGSYFQMSWYQQLSGDSLNLIVVTVPYADADFEDFHKDKFSASKNEAERGSLTVKHVGPGDSGVYFCAVSTHTAL